MSSTTRDKSKERSIRRRGNTGVKCRGTNAEGEPCGAPDRLVGAEGFCEAHQEGGEARMREMASKGGLATARKHHGEGFCEEDLVEITSLEDAKLALDQIRVAVLTRRITHAEATAASRAVSEWVKTEGARMTKVLVVELTAELDAKAREIDELRAELAKSRLRMG